MSAATFCRHERTFFWPLAVFPNGVYGCDACLECGAGQPPYDKRAPVPVPGSWRAVRRAA